MNHHNMRTLHVRISLLQQTQTAHQIAQAQNVLGLDRDAHNRRRLRGGGGVVEQKNVLFVRWER
jgi:hypothetical protein